MLRWRVSVVRDEPRGKPSGFAGGIDPIRGLDFWADGCTRRYRLKHIVVECRFPEIVCMMPRCIAYALQKGHRSGKKQPIYSGK
jgi:hypothetical protein